MFHDICLEVMHLQAFLLSTFGAPRKAAESDSPCRVGLLDSKASGTIMMVPVGAYKQEPFALYWVTGIPVNFFISSYFIAGAARTINDLTKKERRG